MEVRSLPPERSRSVGGSGAVVRATRDAQGGLPVWDDSGPVTMADRTRTPARSLAAVILAAGKGKRLRSSTPKVLHPICGKPALWHVVQAALGARPSRIVIVVGHGAGEVRAAVRSWGISPEPVFVTQREQLGTGHAVRAAKRAVGDAADVLVLGGDYDPITDDHVLELVRAHRRSKAAASMMSAEIDEPGGYGRVVREDARLVRIVEHADASKAERAIREVALLAFAFRRDLLYRELPKVGRENRQGEYYLNEVLPLLMARGERVTVLRVDTGGAMGLNSRGGLAAVTRVVRDRINATHMGNGVTILDPAATYIDIDVEIGPDSVIAPQTYLEGSTRIGEGCRVGPSARIVDSTIGDRSDVQFAVILGSTIGRAVQVGPFVRMRPGVVMEDGSMAGAFIDLKNATVGKGSKVPHLSYVGDASIGEDVNIGAATVTVNYDGYEKHWTDIGDGASVGSDTMLVAPVRIGKGAVTGAGSVITKDVPDGALAVERSEQRIVTGYRGRKDADRRAKGKRKGA
jgi:bifunctional UDP-N-acetylglucosamine pyrophosphorylase/glucosamine-1-phosphate N-acetyltransferase